MKEKQTNDRVECQVHVLAGHAEREIIQYLEKHREVVLAIYDGPLKPEGGDLPERVSGAARVPVVTVQKRLQTA